MKWKDSDADGQKPETNDPYYEDDGYASLKQKGLEKASLYSGNSKRYLTWGIGVAAVVCGVLLLVLFFTSVRQPADAVRLAALAQKIENLEQNLQKYNGVEEKVTRIWEQAQSFENFKTRFDRSESSMSLRMDHLAKSLDALQKKTDENLAKIAKLETAPKVQAVAAVPPTPPSVKTPAAKKIHTVVAGDTLFSISQRYNLSVEQLRSLNKLDEQDVIVIGQKLTVSGPGD
jgi:LysM repeat protein